MSTTRVAAVQASYVLMDRDATVAKVEQLLRRPEVRAADLVVFPEVFVPGTPIWMDSGPIWVGDEDWFALLAREAVVVPSAVTERLGAAARRAKTYLVIGVSEREEHGSTIYNTVLYFGPDGRLLSTHRKLVPTGSERTIWGMGDGSTLEVVRTPFGSIGGLTCWENYMPLARFHLYAQGVDIWLAPTLAQGDGWIATMQHLAREGRMWVIGVNPCLHLGQIPETFPHRERVWPMTEPDGRGWIEPGNTVICDPSGEVVAGPLREEEGVLTADVDVARVAAARRLFDPVGHYNRSDVFQLNVDTRPRPAVTTGPSPV